MSQAKSEYSCPCCDTSFKTKQRLAGHMGGAESNAPWQEESVLRKLYKEQKLSQPEIADKLGCGVTTVTKWMDKLGIETRSQSEAMQERGEFVSSDTPEKLTDGDWLRTQYWEKQKSSRQIAKSIGCSETCVRSWMSKHDIRRRTTEEWSKLLGQKQAEEQTPDVLLNRDELRSLYISENLTIMEIASKVGCAHGTVSKWLSRHDIETSFDYDYPTGEDHWSYNGGLDEYGPGWQAKRRDVRERDGHSCLRCGMTESAHQEKWGQQLHVHHIIPRREFLDSDGELQHNKANALSNLITLCRQCHELLEGVPIDTRPFSSEGPDAE